MNKESLENQVYQITIANLGNNDKVDNVINDNDVIEFNDVEMSFELFKNCFFNNNYRFFELNNQYYDLAELNLKNKTIKNASFKNYKSGTKLDLVDIMNYKFIKNKKTKINDVAKMYLIKDLSAYNSLLDFKVYNNHLSFDNIVSIYNQHINRKTKKYFRFKIKASYYSADLDETLSLYFNYLVKIPKNSKKSKDFIDEIFENNSIVDEYIVDESIIDESIFDEPMDLNKVNTLENIVYSNYKVNKENKENKLNIDMVLHENIVINHDEDEDEDQDDASESNMTESSFGNNESDDPFF